MESRVDGKGSTLFCSGCGMPLLCRRRDDRQWCAGPVFSGLKLWVKHPAIRENINGRSRPIENREWLYREILVQARATRGCDGGYRMFLASSGHERDPMVARDVGPARPASGKTR